MSMFVVRYKPTRWGLRIRYVYYKARIMKNGRAILLGHYPTPEQAAAAYRKALRHG